jgi:hypothetical protein
MLIAVAAAFFAVATLFGSGAEAGFNMRLKAPAGFSAIEKAGCGGGHRRVFRKRSYSTASRSVKRKVEVARAPAASSVSVAKVEVKAEPKAEVASQNVEIENSSISTTSETVAEAKPVEAKPAEKKVAAAKEIGCKKFFPSVGMTLTVSCE